MMRDVFYFTISQPLWVPYAYKACRPRTPDLRLKIPFSRDQLPPHPST